MNKQSSDGGGSCVTATKPDWKINKKMKLKKIPVSLISTWQSSQTVSKRRRSEISWLRRPGQVSSARMSSMRMGVEERVARRRRCRKLWLPSNLLYAVFPILCKHLRSWSCRFWCPRNECRTEKEVNKPYIEGLTPVFVGEIWALIV